MGEDATPPAGGGLLFTELPMADSRTPAYQMIRAAGPVARTGGGGYILTSSEHGRYRRILQPFFSPRATAAWFEYLVGHLEQRRERAGTQDLLGQLLADTSDERLSDEELLGLSFLFVLAGLDTVTSALSTAFAALAAQPRLRRQIAADPAVIPAAVEELLRIDGPVVFLPRVTTTQVRLGEEVIPAGTQVQVAIAVANRDPAEHPDPDEIELRRQERHLAFGGGPHRCLGSHLARMEMREVLTEWHRRIPEYQLAPGTTPRVDWPTGLVGIDSLPLVFPPSARYRP